MPNLLCILMSVGVIYLQYHTRYPRKIELKMHVICVYSIFIGSVFHLSRLRITS